MREDIHFVIKGCTRCHGDLIQDREAEQSRAIIVSECLQCGRPTRFLSEQAPHRSKVAA